MSHYRSDRWHTEFLLFDVLGAADHYGHAPYSDVDPDTAAEILTEVEAFAHRHLAPSFDVAEHDPVRLDPATGRVIVPPGLSDALKAHVSSDWLRLDLSADLTGIHVPPSLRWAAAEFILGANPAVAMCSQLVPQAVNLLHHHGTSDQRRLAEIILDRRWTVTMVLTEPDVGSDVGAACTRAVPQPDGTWHIEGVKRFITWGDHDATENVVHLVLARPTGTPGAGGAGTKGLSLFVVPASHYDPATGRPLGRNGVTTTRIEHKMGLAASPTCELTFGDQAPAVATLLGGKHAGIAQMFEIITYVRMLVGLKATAALSSGHLNARDYATTRRQGHALTTPPQQRTASVPIIEHPDVRRSLLTQKAYAHGARALVLYTATLLDRIEAGRTTSRPDEAAHSRHRLLLPVVKTWCAETAWHQLGSQSLQVLGGSGYLRDYPIEQYVRDTKIDSIYEGTTAIQALDLLQRRILPDNGETLTKLLDDIHTTATDLRGISALADHAATLSRAADAVGGMVTWAIRHAAEDLPLAALGATRILMALGDLTAGWLVLRAAATAVKRQEQSSSGPDIKGWNSVINCGRWYAGQVLPHLTGDLASLMALEPQVLTLTVDEL